MSAGTHVTHVCQSWCRTMRTSVIAVTFTCMSRHRRRIFLSLMGSATPFVFSLAPPTLPLPVTIWDPRRQNSSFSAQQAEMPSRWAFQCSRFPFFSTRGSRVDSVSRVRVFKALSRLTCWRRWGCRDGRFHHLLLSRLIMELQTVQLESQFQWSSVDSSERDRGCF